MKDTQYAPAARGALIVGALMALVHAGDPLAGDRSVLVSTVTAVEQALPETVTAYGVLEPDPDHVIAVSTPRAGLITRVWVELGQRVTSGDRLLEISTAPDALMQFQQAQSAVDFGRRETERAGRLLKEQLGTRAQLEAAQKSLRDAESALGALREKGMGQHTEMARAPVDGIVVRMDVQQGQRVQADSTTLLLASQDQLIARLGVESEDLDRVAPGTKMTVSDVFDDSISFEGQAYLVHGMIDPLTKLVDVLVPVPAAHVGRFVLGSALRARIVLAETAGIVVPRSAVLRDDTGAYLFVVNAGKAQRIAVTTGTAAGDLIQVSGAVAVGSHVVVQGNYGLADGMTVREHPQ